MRIRFLHHASIAREVDSAPASSGVNIRRSLPARTTGKRECYLTHSTGTPETVSECPLSLAAIPRMNGTALGPRLGRRIGIRAFVSPLEHIRVDNAWVERHGRHPQAALQPTRFVKPSMANFEAQ
jgi:hypothetical protein